MGYGMPESDAEIESATCFTRAQADPTANLFFIWNCHCSPTSNPSMEKPSPVADVVLWDEQLDPSRERRGTIHLGPQWPHSENNDKPVKNIISIKLTVQFWNVEKNQFQFHKPAEASRACSMQGHYEHVACRGTTRGIISMQEHHKGHQEHAGVPRAMEHEGASRAPQAWRGITSTTGMQH